MSENLVNPSVTVQLDGSDYVLRYRAMAFIRYAEECGGDLLHDIRGSSAALAEYGRLMQAGDFAALAPILAKVRDILWAGMIDAQPDTERLPLARLFGLSDFPVLVPIIVQAVMASLPKGAENPQKPVAKRRDTRSNIGGDSRPGSELPQVSDSQSLTG